MLPEHIAQIQMVCCTCLGWSARTTPDSKKESQVSATRCINDFSGVDSPFVSAIVLFKNQPFPQVFCGFLKRRIPEKNEEATPRISHATHVLFIGQGAVHMAVMGFSLAYLDQACANNPWTHHSRSFGKRNGKWVSLASAIKPQTGTRGTHRFPAKRSDQKDTHNHAEHHPGTQAQATSLGCHEALPPVGVCVFSRVPFLGLVQWETNGARPPNFHATLRRSLEKNLGYVLV